MFNPGDEREMNKRVCEIWRRENNPDRLTAKEHEFVYRYHHMFVDDASEQTLKYYIDRYSKSGVLNQAWLVLLLAQYPTNENYDLFVRLCAHKDDLLVAVLRGLLKKPEISSATLTLVVTRLVTTRKRNRKKRIRQQVLKKLEEMKKLQAFDPLI
jgi:hypothetical protein